MTTIYQVLKKEHKLVMSLIEQIEKVKEEDPGKAEQLFSQLQEELSLHMEGEEKSLYPALMGNGDLREDVLEAVEEHHVVKVMLNELNRLPKDDERWMAKLTVMQEIVQHHVQEEEGEIFKSARDVLSEKQAEEVYRKYEEEKKRYMAMAL